MEPLRRKAVGGPNNAPRGEVTRYDASLKQDNRQVFRQTQFEFVKYVAVIGKVSVTEFDMTFTVHAVSSSVVDLV